MNSKNKKLFIIACSLVACICVISSLFGIFLGTTYLFENAPSTNNQESDEDEDDNSTNQPLKANAKTTFAIYMQPDDLLLPYTSVNLQEMIDEGGSNENLNIVVYINRDIGSSNSEIVYVGAPEQLNIQTAPYATRFITSDNIRVLKDTYKPTKSKAKELENFLEYANESFPSDNLVVTLWGHGAGWNGSLPEASLDDGLTTADLKEVIGNFNTKTDKKINLLNFDACVMAGIETLEVFDTNLVEYISASSTIVPGEGDGYKHIIENLRAGTYANSEELGKIFIDGFQNKYATDSAYNDLTTLSKALFNGAEYSQFSNIVKEIVNLASDENDGKIDTNLYSYNLKKDDISTLLLDLASFDENIRLMSYYTNYDINKYKESLNKLVPHKFAINGNADLNILNSFFSFYRDGYTSNIKLEDPMEWGKLTRDLYDIDDIPYDISQKPAINIPGVSYGSGLTPEDPMVISYEAFPGNLNISATVPKDAVDVEFFKGLTTEANEIGLMDLNKSTENILNIYNEIEHESYENGAASYSDDKYQYGLQVPEGIYATVFDYEEFFPNKLVKSALLTLNDDIQTDGLVIFDKVTGIIEGYISFGTEENPSIFIIEPERVVSFSVYSKFLDLDTGEMYELLSIAAHDTANPPFAKNEFLYGPIVVGVWVERIDGTQQIDYRYVNFVF